MIAFFNNIEMIFYDWKNLLSHYYLSRRDFEYFVMI